MLLTQFVNGSVWALGSNSDLPRDGRIRLYHSHLKEWGEVTYEVGGILQEGGLRRINHLMRSRDSGLTFPINPELIRLLDHLQDHFGVDTVEVICGYRSPAFNRRLREEGHSAAENSYHLRGYAADIHLDEIEEEELAKYLARLKRGGVGYYPDNLMVHVDIGRVNRWQQGKFSDRRDIGIFNPDLNVAITTDHLFYHSGMKQKIAISNPDGVLLKEELILEHFFRGKWDTVSQSPFACHREPQRGAAPKGPPLGAVQMTQLDCFACARNDTRGVCVNPAYGKYRWKVEAQDGRVQTSSEFYLKR